MLLPTVYNIAEICARLGVTEVLLSPGSRCAPLTLAFVRHPRTRTRTVSDERSAAFIALGIALTTGRAAALVCTSGTASLNYAPAIAEAFYQQVPLVIFTADRPPEWIDQQDGQTIRQQDVYGRHVKKSFAFPADLTHPDANWYATRMISEAIMEAHAFPPGPVHVNVPLREPFYPTAGEQVSFDPQVKVIEEVQNKYALNREVAGDLNRKMASFPKVLVVAGQQGFSPDLLESLDAFSRTTGAVVVGDIISNTHPLPSTLRYHDVTLSLPHKQLLEQLQPDLLLTFGKSILSKNLKQYLRAYPPQEHWHVQPAGAVADTFQSLSRIIRVAPASFFETMATHAPPSAPPSATGAYANHWNAAEQHAAAFLTGFFKTAPFNEFSAFRLVMRHLPQLSNLHLANSMAVRYANLIGLESRHRIMVFANRGTSGIDGSTSTAVGTALSSPLPTTLLTGDMAFFYDRNGLWHNYLPPHLRIVVFNNHGGGIFRLIEGPGQQPELDEYFETHQPLSAEQTARDFGMRYLACSSLEQIQQAMPAVFAPAGQPSILEIMTDSRENTAFFKEYKSALQLA